MAHAALMQTYIKAIPGWDSTVMGAQLGVIVAVTLIIVLGLIGRALMVNLLPRLLSKWLEGKQGLAEFQLTARFPIGAAAAGFIWWQMFEMLSRQTDLALHSEFVFWSVSSTKAVFLIGSLLGAMRLVEVIELIARWIDDDGELDGTQITLIDALQSVIKFISFIFNHFLV